MNAASVPCHHPSNDSHETLCAGDVHLPLWTTSPLSSALLSALIDPTYAPASGGSWQEAGGGEGGQGFSLQAVPLEVTRGCLWTEVSASLKAAGAAQPFLPGLRKPLPHMVPLGLGADSSAGISGSSYCPTPHTPTSLKITPL